MEAARALISVQAGIIPGTAEPEYTKQWALTSAQWEADGGVALEQIVVEATNYATLLMLSPSQVNWVRTEWIWL